MPEHTDEMAAIEIGEDCDHGIARGAAGRDDRDKFPLVVMRGARRCEEHAGGEREGNGGCRGERTRAAAFEEFQEHGYATLAELAVQVYRSGLASQAERGVCPGDGTGGRNSGAFVPRRVMTAGQESNQKVRAAEGGNWRTVQHREKEKPERSEVPEYGGEPHARNYSKAFVSNE